MNRYAATALGVTIAGLAVTLAHEGFVEEAMIPTKNDRPTVGFGSTFHADGTPVKLGDKITREEALELAKTHINKEVVAKIAPCIKGKVNQEEFNILADFAYQYGASMTCKSSMVRFVNEGNYTQSCKSYPLYVYSGGMDCRVFFRECGGVITRNNDRMKRCLAAQ